MTVDSRGLDSVGSVIRLFEGISAIKKFTYGNNPPFDHQLSMCYRVVGKTKDIFLQGPAPNATVITMDENWNRVYQGLEDLKKKFINHENNGDKPIYAFLTTIEDEGVTIWGLCPDSWFLEQPEESEKENKKGGEKGEPKDNKDKGGDKEAEKKKEENTPLKKLGFFNKTVKQYLKSRQWATAFNEALKVIPEDKRKDPTTTSFAILFLASVTSRTIPWFGKVAWGLSYKNGIVALTQIPLMVKSNRDQYFQWSFVPKSGSWNEQSLHSTYGKNGGMQTYSSFTKLRKFLEDECVPLSDKASTYGFTRDGKKGAVEEPKNQTLTRDIDDKKNDENTNELLDQARDNGYTESLNESYQYALSYLVNEQYHIIGEYSKSYFGSSKDVEDDPDNVGKDPNVLPTGDPYKNTLKFGANNTPLIGPQY
jgi:hypothetical protein